jgi:LmbE family N-acetylglucosaminyl deacetylase
MIGAHPDDCEYHAGGTAVRFRKAGAAVKFISMTTGETGHYAMGPLQMRTRRQQETEKVAALIGVEYQVLEIASNRLEADLAMRERTICLIRDYRPDLVFTHRLNDYHPDHRRTAMLVQDSAYALRIPNVCPNTPYLRHTPVILYMHDDFRKPTPFAPDVMVPIDEVLDTKIQMLHCHESQFYEWLPWMAGELEKVPPRERIQARLEWLGNSVKQWSAACAEQYRARLIELFGSDDGLQAHYAEAFEISEYGGALARDRFPDSFPWMGR